MRPSQQCPLIGIFVVFLWSAANAQPTLPRDRAPVVDSGIRSLVGRLYSPDPKERAEAACQLGRRHEEAASAIPILLSMLGDAVTVPAVECDMSPWLRRTLANSPDAQKWAQTSPAKEAAEALGNIGNTAAPGLLQALAHSDSTVRTFAALGLGEIHNLMDRAKVTEALVARLDDAHPGVRERSAWALGEIEDSAAVEPLALALKDKEPKVRARAAWALGEIEDPSAVMPLVAALSDGDDAVREQSVWALGEIESDTAVEGLLPLLKDASGKVRRQTAWALGEIESPAAITDLVQTLADTDADVRRQAAWALGEIEDVSAVDGLVRALTDSDWQVRKTAAWALGEIGDVRAIDSLQAAARDGNGEVRRAIAQALRELRDQRQ